jgi:hypothetical protein
MPGIWKWNYRLSTDSSTMNKRPHMQSAARAAALPYTALSSRRIDSALEGVDDGFAFSPGFFQPFLHDGVAHLFHVGLELGRRC